MIQMRNEISRLFSSTPPVTAPYISGLLGAYQPKAPNTVLCLGLYPEPYYGDYSKCSMVLLTHNPGGSTAKDKGVGSPFEKRLLLGTDRASNYHQMAVIPDFVNKRTNRWILKLNKELGAHFQGIQQYEEKLFIRDLVPYHSERFGSIDMFSCRSYLYNHFFGQVISASFKSELFNRINSKKTNPATIVYARGSAWNGKKGLSSIGWKHIGRIFSYCNIYKADFNAIFGMVEFDIESYPPEFRNFNIYVVVLTTIRDGGFPLGIYSRLRDPASLIALTDVYGLYYEATLNGAKSDITHNEEMDLFFQVIR